MTEQPDAGPAVRVLNADGVTVGMGVLVGPREILTCAHVVNTALGLDSRAQDQPAGDVTLEFAVGDGLALRARVQRWLPPPRTGAAGDDIAGLVVTGAELPTGVAPARLATNLPTRGRVVGLLAAAPLAPSGERDSYAITADRLRLAWPEVLNPRRAQPPGADRARGQRAGRAARVRSPVRPSSPLRWQRPDSGRPGS